MIDRVMWMLPFVTRDDLEAAAQQADVNMETINHFLNKLLHEHGQTGIRKQLQTSWTEWVEKNYGDNNRRCRLLQVLRWKQRPHLMMTMCRPSIQLAPVAGRAVAGRAICWLTGRPLVDMDGTRACPCWTMRGSILVEQLMMQRYFNEIPFPKLRWITTTLQLHYHCITTA
jgi:hypothetical protein